jgi:formylglycine-generating enzyme required for sulfatase activity
MKSPRPVVYFNIILLILMAACAPKATPAPTTVPATDTPALVPINLAGPEMRVGSTFLYADGTTLVAVPAGIFTMGNGEPRGRPENPEHPVNLSDFWIYRTKVTNAQYAYCVAMGGCTAPFGPENPGFDDYLKANDPVVGVDYSQAADYCNFVHARLPTEAEWEKTARGLEAGLYPWGDEAPTCALLNYGSCFGKTTPVNSYPDGQSYYTAYDMEGNALEWVADWFQADYYLEAPADDPQGPDSGRGRSVRSSAFNSGGDQIPAFTRSFSPPDTQRDNLGFRCVVEDPTYFAPFCTYPATYGTDGIGGAASGPQSTLDCPVISIQQSPYCQGTKPKTIVTFELSFAGPLYSLTYQVPGSCGFGLSNLKWDCSEVSPGQGGGGEPLIFCSYCNVTLASPPQCPWGYTYDDSADACLKDSASSGGGACLPGFTPDATGQCCTFDPPEVTDLSTGFNVFCDYLTEGSPAVICHPPFPSCPVGTNFAGDECISTEHPKFCITQPLEFSSCTPGGGEEGPLGCPDPGCGTNYAWDPVTCSCVCDGC